MQILYYDGGLMEKRIAVETVLQQFPFPYRMLDEIDVAQTLGYLMELEGYEQIESSSSTTISQDLLIMKDLDDEQIQKLSNTLRKQHCHIECKAMLTSHNKDWTVSSLLKEIIEEHAYFQSYDALKQCIIEASEEIRESYTKESWDIYQQEFLQGYTLLQEQEVAKHLLDEAIKRIQNAKEKLQLI